MEKYTFFISRIILLNNTLYTPNLMQYIAFVFIEKKLNGLIHKLNGQ